jgi:hypothetical protein
MRQPQQAAQAKELTSERPEMQDCRRRMVPMLRGFPHARNSHRSGLSHERVATACMAAATLLSRNAVAFAFSIWPYSDACRTSQGVRLTVQC